jgi:hypothetical protein
MGGSFMSASAGRVLLKPKGPYNALTAYTPLDYVTYTDGNTYVCHTPTTGHAPTDTNYWQILVDNSGVVHTVDIANDLTTQTAGKVLDARQGYALNTSLANKADQTDLASIHLTGTNTTGSTIAEGTYFYNNGTLRRATGSINNNASITNQNSEAVTAGALNTMLAPETFNVEPYDNNITLNSTHCYKWGNLVVISFGVIFTTPATGTNIALLKIPLKYCPTDIRPCSAFDNQHDIPLCGNIVKPSTSDIYEIHVYRSSEQSSVGISSVRGFAAYIIP